MRRSRRRADATPPSSHAPLAEIPRNVTPQKNYAHARKAPCRRAFWIRKSSSSERAHATMRYRYYSGLRLNYASSEIHEVIKSSWHGCWVSSAIKCLGHTQLSVCIGTLSTNFNHHMCPKDRYSYPPMYQVIYVAKGVRF